MPPGPSCLGFSLADARPTVNCRTTSALTQSSADETAVLSMMRSLPCFAGGAGFGIAYRTLLMDLRVSPFRTAIPPSPTSRMHSGVPASSPHSCARTVPCTRPPLPGLKLPGWHPRGSRATMPNSKTSVCAVMRFSVYFGAMPRCFLRLPPPCSRIGSVPIFTRRSHVSKPYAGLSGVHRSGFEFEMGRRGRLLRTWPDSAPQQRRCPTCQTRFA